LFVDRHATDPRRESALISAAPTEIRHDDKRHAGMLRLEDPFVEVALKGNDALLREWKNRQQVVVSVRSPAADAGASPAQAAAARQRSHYTQAAAFEGGRLRSLALARPASNLREPMIHL